MESPRRPLTSAQRSFLLAELPVWEREGLLPPSSHAPLLALYAPNDASLRGSLAAFAAALLFFAAMLLVSFNWALIPISIKVVGALLLVGGAHAGAAALEARSACGSGAARFSACLAFGVALWLLLQASHASVGSATVGGALWWWALGTLGALLGAPARAPGGGALHALLAALNASVVALALLPTLFSEKGASVPALLCTLPLLLAAAAAAAARGSAVGVGLHLPALLGVSMALLWRLLGLATFALRVLSIGAVGAALSLLVEAAGDGLAAGAPAARGWATAMAVCALWACLDGGAGLLQVGGGGSGGGGGGGDALWGAALCLALPLTALAGAARLRGVPIAAAARAPGAPPALAVAAVCAAAPLLLALAAPDGSPTLAAASNAAVLGVAVALVRVGHCDGRTAPMAWGALLVLAWSLRLYIIAGGGYLLTAAFFVAGSALFGLLAWRAGGSGGGGGQQQQQRLPPSDGIAGAVDVLKLLPTHPACVGSAAASAAALAERAAGALPPRLKSALPPAGAAQLAFLALFAAARFAPAAVGARVSLACAPVDPRDLFRGDFVVLAYEIERGVVDAARDRGSEYGDPAFAVLAPPAEAGGVWTLQSAGEAPPPLLSGDVYIAGTLGGRGFDFGADAFFVQEGAGRRWEAAARERRLVADVAVAPWGQALLLGLRCPAPLVAPEERAERAENALVDLFELCPGAANAVRSSAAFGRAGAPPLPSDDRELAAALAARPLQQLAATMAGMPWAACPAVAMKALAALQELAEVRGQGEC
jgi:hypothetical protein